MIEEDERFEANEKTKIVSIGDWTYYQNTYIKGSPAWACHFGKNYCCTIYKIDTDLYKLVVKKGAWPSKDCEVIKDCYLSSFEHAQSSCKEYID